MALKETTNKLKGLLGEICSDIEKAERGNKAAAQRVRTGTIRLEKTAKLYRKESIAIEKKGGLKKSAKAKPAAKKAKSAKKVKQAKRAALVRKPRSVARKPNKRAAARRRG